jgi:uncharacterized membrane protein
MTLGARGSKLLWMFLRRTLLQLTLGVALGLAGALAVGQLLKTFLVGTGARDPLTLAVVEQPLSRACHVRFRTALAYHEPPSCYFSV